MSALADAARWARAAFPAATAEQHHAKATQEWAEHLDAATTRDAVEEAADVCIALSAWAAACGYDLERLVAYKVGINAQRLWVLQPDGTFQHAPAVSS